MKYIIIFTFTFFSFSSSRAQCNDNVLEAFGGVSSITLYNTYITIGALADGHVNDVYDADYIQTLMKEQIGMMDKLSDMLTLAYKDGGLSEDDKEYLMDIMICFDALKSEAEGLSNFATTGSEEAQNQYNDSRELAWEYIKVILGLD